MDAAAHTAGGQLEVLGAVNVMVPGGLLVPDLVVADSEFAAGADLTFDCSDVVLVVEIVEPATRPTDVHLNPALYAAAGIEHYWRLKPDPVPRLHLGHLERGTYTDRLVRAGETTALTDPFPL
ncbi:Uma2 family endonuclease [Kitasatospora sp. NPDC059571]|uniref:Uma2 family endonuclease n=1 Tax=Kitasatospora sp. NPDC059571 TaxID=3346871 RepID=UPI0036ABF2FE